MAEGFIENFTEHADDAWLTSNGANMVEHVEQAVEKLSVRPGRKVCEAMRGLVEEAQHEIEEQDEKGPILDLVIVAGMQRIEHYEIAAWRDVTAPQATALRRELAGVG